MQDWQKNKKFVRTWNKAEETLDIIHHKHDGKLIATTASLFYNRKRLVGAAFCNDRDAFNKSVGRNIAIGRLKKFVAQQLKLVKWDSEYEVAIGPKNTTPSVIKTTQPNGATLPSIILTKLIKPKS